jgi:hypothetical protein
MKKSIVSLSMILLIAFAFVSYITLVSAESEPSSDFHITPALPEGIPQEPLSENTTIGDNYLNTTYATTGALDEVDDEEGNRPLYVLVFGDEEERGTYRSFPGDSFPVRSWINWAKYQIERGDEQLVAKWDIDVRILGFEEWDSDDNIDTMAQRWHELESDTERCLNQWYDGEYWSNYVDAIIGITAQDHWDEVAGLTSGLLDKDQGRIFILLDWQIYWADDNLAQHELSHLYYARDHVYPCCAMAYHAHYQYFIIDDAIWAVFHDIACAYTSYDWCSTCRSIISSYVDLYDEWDYNLLLRHGDPAAPHGTLSYQTTIYCSNLPFEMTISVISNNSDYKFDYWLIDGRSKVHETSITVYVDSEKHIAAYFKAEPTKRSRSGGPGKWALMK